MPEIALEPSWLAHLREEFAKPYMVELREFLLSEKRAGRTVYPPSPQIFNALNTTPFDQVKVIILGQDPYHGQGQANGLCFSVSPGIAIPPSLQNIFKELASDCQIKEPTSGDLTPWAEQGVLLLNATLTVRAREAGSHQKKGWEQLTDHIISLLSSKREGLVFLLWGAYARAKKTLIDPSRHHVLEAAHPSPFSAYAGFMGCHHFSQTNAFLLKQGNPPINWKI